MHHQINSSTYGWLNAVRCDTNIDTGILSGGRGDVQSVGVHIVFTFEVERDKFRKL